MPETKGRSGKKPKYQIADIAGPDLTSEDISTERVLNFLIKGEMGSMGSSAPPVLETRKDEAIQTPVTQGDSQLLPPISDYPEKSEQTAKKSLSHLFERAGSGSSRETSTQASETESSPLPGKADRELDQAADSVNVSDPEPQLTIPVPVSDTLGPAENTVALPSTHVPAAPGLLLADEIDRWKNLYRLNSGEIAALRSLFLLAGEYEQSECYVKMRRLAEMSNLDYRYCQKVVRSLERLGWITKLQDYDASTQLGVLYRVNTRPVHLT